jgi:hypothetical protein
MSYKYEMVLWILLVALFSPLAFLLMPVIVALSLVGGLIFLIVSAVHRKHQVKAS